MRRLQGAAMATGAARSRLRRKRRSGGARRSYVPTALGRAERQELLREQWCFECACTRCAAEAEAGPEAGPGACGTPCASEQGAAATGC